jgi:hypothetical protein
MATHRRDPRALEVLNGGAPKIAQDEVDANLSVTAAQFLLVPTPVHARWEIRGTTRGTSVGRFRAFEGVSGLYDIGAQLRTKASNSLTFLMVAPTGFEPVFQP